MNITQGLFSDVLANAPQSFANPYAPQKTSTDWSKTLPMAGAVDWTKVRPFEVINPLTGYNYGATQPKQETKPTEYQKWLSSQSVQETTAPQKASDVGPRNGRNTNAYGVSDRSFAEAKDARDYAQGWNNQDKVAGELFASLVTSPVNTIKNLEQFKEKMKEAEATDSLFASMLAADREAANVSQTQATQQAGSLLPGMAVAGANTIANPMALDPQQALAKQAGYDASGDTSPSGYAADGMGPPASAAPTPEAAHALAKEMGISLSGKNKDMSLSGFMSAFMGFNPNRTFGDNNGSGSDYSNSRYGNDFGPSYGGPDGPGTAFA